MKILHINQSDVVGGAAIAGYRLHHGLLAQKFNSKLLVGTVKTSSDRVASVPPRKYWIENQIGCLTKWLGLNYLEIVSTFDIHKHPFYIEADILNLHNLHTGYFNYLSLPFLAQDKSVVFTLHDMWSFTGHCAYSFGCARWKTGCGKCPYPDTYPAISRDNTHLEWKLKNWLYSHSNFTVVVPSCWLAKLAGQSMLNRFPVYHIPNGIDVETYQPLDSEQCRSILGIPANKKVIMFGAETITDPRKGGDLLLKTLQSLPISLKAEIFLLILGYGSEILVQTVNIPALNLGYISSDRLKSIAYSAADLFVFPTRADNLPLVLQESLACGTPIVSFNVGGVPDLVRPGITGYLAQPEDVQDFCSGIIEILEDQTLRNQMHHHCRSIAFTEYSLELQSKRYIELYRQILGEL